jgi:hypothetical protein
VTRDRLLPCLASKSAVFSLIYFAHDAEFLPDQPNLPATWTRKGVYLSWLGTSFVAAVPRYPMKGD